MKSEVLSLVVMLAATGFAACGGSTNGAAPAQDAGATTDDGGAVDSGDTPDAAEEAAPPLDHGAPSTTFPAFKSDLPQLHDNGGGVIASPAIVAITWDTDPAQAALDDFTMKIGASEYWTKVVSEYGVGPATATTVHIPVDATHPLPASFTQGTVDQFVDQNAGAAASGWPAPTPQTIYVVYLHPSTVLTAQGGNACQVLGGYHSSTQQSGVIYAILPRCGSGAQAVAETTVSASHELGEAATDPSQGALTYFGFDGAHGAWDLFNQFQVENADACEFYLDSSYMETAPLTYY
ncbi:MAG: hypothetical protein ACHREM_31265, partial [Polyangiales bacterium]